MTKTRKAQTPDFDTLIVMTVALAGLVVIALSLFWYFA